jgi:Domain of unknown function (DUF4062)
MSKRYQVFVSSTYADLKEERTKVMQALMELDCIPAGMELFPAADEEQFEFIKRVIDDCDYYLLIIGGRYGSLTREGISFTEQEYDYAVHRELRVIALIHESPDDIAFGKSEKDPELRAQLDRFRSKVSTDRLVRFWKVAQELPGLVALSISKTIKMYPAVGWVRADKTASEDMLTELNEVRKQNDVLAKQLAIAERAAKPVTRVEDLAGLDDSIVLNGVGSDRGREISWKVSATWSELFALIAPYLVKHPNEATVKSVLDDALSKKNGTDLYLPKIVDQDFQTVGVQLRALGLVKMDYTKNVQGGMGLFWSATPAGEVLTYQLRTIRAK